MKPPSFREIVVPGTCFYCIHNHAFDADCIDCKKHDFTSNTCSYTRTCDDVEEEKEE